MKSVPWLFFCTATFQEIIIATSVCVIIGQKKENVNNLLWLYQIIDTHGNYYYGAFYFSICMLPFAKLHVFIISLSRNNWNFRYHTCLMDYNNLLFFGELWAYKFNLVHNYIGSVFSCLIRLPNFNIQFVNPNTVHFQWSVKAYDSVFY